MGVVKGKIRIGKARDRQYLSRQGSRQIRRKVNNLPPSSVIPPPMNFKDYSTTTATRLFLVTLVVVIGCALLGSALLFYITHAQDIDVTSGFTEPLTAAQRQYLRLALLISNGLQFAVGAAVSLWLVFRGNWWRKAGLDQAPRPYSLGFSIGVVLLSLPLVAYLVYLNALIPLPEWAVQDEAQSDGIAATLMQMESPLELLMSLLVVGVTAAVGEELLLRGVLQRRVLQVWLGNHHAAIWLAAFVFSLLHFEFAGLIPRMLLGAAFGYAYHWSRSLWIPIGLHFVFNSFQVVVAYVTGEFDSSATAQEAPEWWMAALSLVAFIAVLVMGELKFGDEPVETAEVDLLLDN